jgi:cell division protein FtsI (penicillin-binding protein 3)
MKSKTSRIGNARRLYLFGAILVFWCCAICARLVYLQIFRYGDFVERAEHQQQRSVELSAKRGVIYDRAGHELAMSVSVDSVFAVPNQQGDLTNAASLIGHITHEDPHDILARCAASKSFCWIARKTDAETAERIKALNLRGIYFEKETRRFYPKRELAAQVLGYAGMDDKGLSGIERQFRDELSGEPGEISVSVDARRKDFSSVEKQPDPGENVVLTIDQQIQYIAERELDAAVKETRAEAGTVVIENPHTGEVLALANWPTFNPNVPREITPKKLINHAVSDVYEPGSTFKIVTIAAGLEEKLINPNEVFDCQMGSIVVNGLKIHDWKPYGMLTVSDILAKSSDVGAIKIALRLGNDRFYKYIHGFGFGTRTGIELPHETRGLAKPASEWSKVSIGAISMGQEIGVTPLQLAATVSTIANDGVWVAPRIVAGVIPPQDSPQTIAFHPVNERRVLSTMTAAQMKQMLQGVVLHGTGRKAILEGYSSAGKTGTAQKFDRTKKMYSRTQYIASFAGFAPVNNPAITVVVILDSPATDHHGGMVGAPIFQRIAQPVLEYLHVPHDVELPANRQVLLAERRVTEQDTEEGSPDRLGDAIDVDDSSSIADSVPEPQTKPSAGVVQAAMRQYEQTPTPVAANPKPSASVSAPPATSTPAPPMTGTVVVSVEQGGIVVPSFSGKSVRAAVELAESSGLDLDIVGSGLGVDQSPAAGSHVAAGSRITVRFGR